MYKWPFHLKGGDFVRRIFSVSFGLMFSLLLDVFGASALYVTQSGLNQVSVIDVSMAPFTIVDTIAVGGSPIGIASDPQGRYLYVANSADNTVSQIDVSVSPATTTTIALSPNSQQPFSVVITPDGRYAFIGKISPTLSVDAINLFAEGGPVYEYSIGPLSGLPLSLAVTADSSLLYIPDNSGTVTVFNTFTKTIETSFVGGADLSAIQITPSTNLVITGSTGNPSSIIYYQAGTTPPVTGGVLPLGGNYFIPSLALNPNGAAAYAAVQTVNEIQDIDLRSLFPSLDGSLALGAEPSDIIASSDGTTGYVTLNSTNQVIELDLTVSPPILTGNNIAITAPSRMAFALQGVNPFPQPPGSISGFQKKNRFLFEYEIFNKITWAPSPSTSISEYKVLKNGVQVASVSPLNPLEFEEHNLPRGGTYLYQVISVGVNGLQSASARIEIIGDQ